MIIEMQPTAGTIVNKVTSSHLFKQVMVATAAGLLCMCGGFTYGHSAVLVPRLKEDQSFSYDDYYDSWIASISLLSMAFGCILSGVLSDRLGRKYTSILLLWPFMVGYLVTGFAKSITYLLIGRFLTGLCTGVFRTLGAVYIVEVADPENRALLQFTLSICSTSGVLISHVTGAYLSQKHSSVLFTSPIFIAFILIVFMKDSPMWLISKGRIDEGIDSFHWYRSNTEASQKELREVLENQKTKSDDLTFVDTIQIIFSKVFLKPYFTGFVLFTIAQFCGINNLTFYAHELLQPIFSDTISSFTLMIIVDGLRIAGNILLLPVLKYCPRRKTYFINTCIIVLLLIGVIVYLITEPAGLTWLLLACMIIFMLVGSVTISLAWTFVAEIYPNEIRGIGSGASSSTSSLLLFVSVKFTPAIMASFGAVALYSTFAMVTFISLVFLYFWLPDTDGKTLLEIENEYNTS